MAKLWAGRTAGNLNEIADKLNASIGFDKRLYREDITGSIAHAKMLAKTGIISEEEGILLADELTNILNELDEGIIEIDETCEDIHTFVEQVLTERLGDIGKKIHTARSRNDQSVLDLRMYLRTEVSEIIELTHTLCEVLVETAEKHLGVVMPGYTHLQRAQPVLFSHHILTYAFMFMRDIDRLNDSLKRIDVSPIGSCALAGTTYDTDRYFEAEQLGFNNIAMNSMDGVSDRDFCLEVMSDLSIIMMHMSRFAEELILWSSFEFKYIELADEFTTGSSIMPQKKNSDMAELIRGKTGRVYGDMLSLFTTLKGLPLAYNKDMQEDKEPLFDSVDTVKLCLQVMIPMIDTMKIIPENMKKAANEGFINATDLADYLTKKGMPFRTAYKISGEIVSDCIKTGYVLETLPIEKYQQYSELFEEDIYEEINIENIVDKRTSTGGTSTSSVKEEIEYIKEKLKAGKLY